MSKYKVIGFDRMSDKEQTVYLVWLRKTVVKNGKTYTSTQNIVVKELPEKVYGAEVTVDWKSETITKVEGK